MKELVFIKYFRGRFSPFGCGGAAFYRHCWRASGFLLSALVLFTSCALQNRTQLFRNPAHEKVYKAGVKKGLSLIKLKPTQEDLQYYRYRINQGDEIRVRFLNLPPELGEGVYKLEPDGKYIVSTDGYIALPLLGRIYVQHKTTDEIQKKLFAEYAAYFPIPSLDVSVTNLKVYVFGEGRQGVIILPNERTHLIEALALAGGVPNSAKPYKIKIIRGNLQDPQIIWVNPRDITVLGSQELYMHSGDVIYLEPRNMQLFIREVAPYTTVINLVTLLPTIYILLRNIGVF